MPSLFLVSTPIGNLGDLSHRAVAVLGAADVIMAEDTRRTATLLRHYAIEGRLISAHEHNEAARSRLLPELLAEGKDVALVSDAGTPLLSDPGGRLVRSALEAGFDVVPVPGASALLAALVASGLGADRFTFLGFLPRRGGARDELLRAVAESPFTSVLYEAPQRIVALLDDLAAAAGGGRRVAVARELTKLHEQFLRGTLEEVSALLAATEPRGEFVVVVDSRPEPPADEAKESGEARILAEALIAQGVAPSAAARELRQRLRISRNEAYQLVQEIASDEG